MLLPPGLAAPTVERPPLRPITSKQVLFWGAVRERSSESNIYNKLSERKRNGEE
jgi:hypothetical protein